VGPRNHVLDGGADPPGEGAIFGGKVAARCKQRSSLQDIGVMHQLHQAITERA